MMRCWDRMTFLFAPKGPKPSSPGQRPGNLGTTLHRALKGRNGGDITRTFTCTALSGLAVGGNSPSLPRALPWADLSWPLRGVVFPRRFSHRGFEEGAGRANSLLCFPCCVDLFSGFPATPANVRRFSRSSCSIYIEAISLIGGNHDDRFRPRPAAR